MSLLDLKSNLDNRNAFGGARQTQSTFNVNGTLSQPDIPDPTVNEASIIDGGMGTTIEEKFFHGKADPGKTDGKKRGYIKGKREGVSPSKRNGSPFKNKEETSLGKNLKKLDCFT